MVIPQSGSYITIPTLKEKKKKKKRKRYIQNNKKEEFTLPRKRKKNDQFCLISLADAMFLK